MKRMYFTTNKKNYFVAGIFSIAGCFLMLLFPEIAMNGCESGIQLFFGSVLPTLLPFFIAINFMMQLGIPELIGRHFEPFFRRLYGCSGLGAFICIVSVTSGYPMGAKLVGDFCRQGRLSTEEGKKILSFSSTSGPLFLVGTVGTAMLGNSTCGYIIAAGHYLGAMLCGLFFCRFFIRKEDKTKKMPEKQKFPTKRKGHTEGIAEELSQSMLSSFRTLCLICGYIVLFSILSEYLQFARILQVISTPWGRGLVKGLLEMTMGCDAIANANGISGVFRMALCSFLVSFGGLSIAGQSLSVLSGSGIKGSYYLFMKLIHGLMAGVTTFLIAFIWEEKISASLVYGIESEPLHILGGIHSLLFSVKTIIMIGILMLILVWLDGIRRKIVINYKKRKQS